MAASAEAELYEQMKLLFEQLIRTDRLLEEHIEALAFELAVVKGSLLRTKADVERLEARSG